ncbi:hypothetical protein L7F22_031752 [Adiantum nelumboides]|nr:hypothetical protein [Adiantum nelumboides]
MTPDEKAKAGVIVATSHQRIKRLIWLSRDALGATSKGIESKTVRNGRISIWQLHHVQISRTHTSSLTPIKSARRENVGYDPCILWTVPTCQNLYKNSFTYKTIKEDQMLPFDDCSEFIEQSRTENARVLVHCMSGQNRSPAVVIAYLMRYKGWRLAESFQWVKDRRPSINLSSAVGEQLQLYEAKIFGPSISHTPMVPSESGLGFNFGFPATTPGTTALFSTSLTPSSSSSFLSFSQGNGSADQSSFVFGAVRQEVGAGIVNSMDSAMDSSS